MSKNAPGHPIQVVARRTGLSQDVLRAWERRYRVVEPEREGPSHRRLYSDADIRRLKALRQAVEGGRSVSALARLGTEALEALVAEDARSLMPRAALRRGRPAARASSVEPVSPSARLAQALHAIRELDAGRSDAALRQAAVDLSRPRLFSEFLVPLLHQIGDQWSAGTLRAAHEHLASVVIRSFVSALLRGEAPLGAPRLLACTPPAQLHEFGALLATLVAADAGWSATYLGPNLPIEDIAAAALALNVRVVAISAVYPPGDARLLAELTGLYEALPESMSIVVGGAGARHVALALSQAGLLPTDDFDELRALLDRLLREEPQ